MNNLDNKYLSLLQEILDNGFDKEDRTGTGTKSIFGKQLEFNMAEGFPLLTTKKVHFKSVAHELLWFLRGETNIRSLVKEGVTIWSEWPYQNYYDFASHLEEPDYRYHIDDPHENITRMMTIEEFNQTVVADESFAKEFGNLGPVYGKQWIDWGGAIGRKHQTMTGGHVHFQGINQIDKLIDDLKNNPDSRRMMVNAWNVAEVDTMALPPCHYGFQVYTRELCNGERRDWVIKNRSQQMPKFFDRLGWEGNVAEVLEKFNAPTRAISLMWNQRSVDTFLGLPFNIASYGLLLHMLADVVNMVPDKLICNLGDVHIYNNHIDFAKEQISRQPFEKLPKLVIKNKRANVTHYSYEDFEVVDYKAHPNFKNVPIAV
jgi:thymidylate synthase